MFTLSQKQCSSSEGERESGTTHFISSGENKSARDYCAHFNGDIRFKKKMAPICRKWVSLIIDLD